MENSYIQASADIVVKYLLGVPETESALINFINAVFEDSGFKPVSSVTIQNPFNIKNFIQDKASVLDIKARDEGGKTINIEIQSTGDRHFINRSLYYWSRLYSSDIRESDVYSRLEPVVCINLLNFIIFPETEKIHNCFLLKEKDENYYLTDHQEIHFVELPKLKESMNSSQLEQWLVYLQYEGRKDKKAMTLVNQVMKMNRELKATHKRYKQFTQDEEMRDLYEARVKFQRDIASQLESGREEGLELGRKEGRKEGRRDGLEEGRREGLEEGRKEGLEEGRKEGLEEGRFIEKQKILIHLLKRKFSIDRATETRILSEKNVNTLDKAMEILLFTDNPEEVLSLFESD